MDTAVIVTVLVVWATCLFGARLASISAGAAALVLAVNMFGVLPAATMASDIHAKQDRTTRAAHCKLDAYESKDGGDPTRLAVAQRTCQRGR